ncbi:MAG: tryptophan 7-halogenase [Henriciella sp.]
MAVATQDFDDTIVVCGGGLAGHMAALYLSIRLGRARRLVLLPDAGTSEHDGMYGSVTAPNGYEFFRLLGLDEPRLIQQSATSYSFGTHFRAWPAPNREWVQCHHAPLAGVKGVAFQDHLTRQKLDLQTLLVSAAAARAGVFAHPPQDPRIPLSRAEYGYQFDPAELAGLLAGRIPSADINVVSGEIADVTVSNGSIEALTLSSGDRITGGLFLDCSGPSRLLLSALPSAFEAERSVSAERESTPSETLGGSARLLEATDTGWAATTYLQDRSVRLYISDADHGNGVEIGRVPEAWTGNCVGIGHAAYVIEPLTPAPLMLLQADLERLIELIPVAPNMQMERQEYNRRFDNDVLHAGLFQSALFTGLNPPTSPYWQTVVACAPSEALDRKISQFEHRGGLVRYDLEPFDDADWLILHNGMGRKPSQYDRQANGTPQDVMNKQFAGLQNSIQQVVSRMPSHHDYVLNLKRYLAKQSKS